MSLTREFQHLRIPLEDILSATKAFDDSNFIGKGGFGKVYAGELLHSEGFSRVAVKRLDRALGQGEPEFWKEIMLLSRYQHENIVSLLGFCDESDERILVFEYLSNRSLDMHLSSTDLSWNQRLHICIGAARGLKHLHDPLGTLQRVLHRDIKSSNILLDENWNAKITDFGLSKFGPANQQYTFLVSNGVGTIGYVDPVYVETGYLSKEADVYSFGVVLFEVLCGKLVFDGGQRRALVPFWRKGYEENMLDTIVAESIMGQISPDCLERFSGVAYRCLRRDRGERPSMAELVTDLEISLQYQVEYEYEKEHGYPRRREEESESDEDSLNHEEETDSDAGENEGEYWEKKLPRDYELLIKMFNIPRAIYTIKKELYSLLHKGILFDEGNKFLRINNDGKKCVLVSARRFLTLDESDDHHWVFHPGNLRFSVVADYHYGKWPEIRCQIKTSILSLGTNYAANLVFRYTKKPNKDLKHLKLMNIKWKTEESSVYSTHNAELTQDNWYKIRMWNFFNHGPNADFDIVIEELSYYDDPIESDLSIQGIEFQPIEMASFKFSFHFI
ncbi:putative receptor-like protein kinase [Tanacetum coccineum]